MMFGAPPRPARVPPRPTEAARGRTIPFEYAFRFELTGEPNRLITKTLTISVEAAFVAHAIGYGVIPRAEVARFGPAPVVINGGGGLPAPSSLRALTIGGLLDGLAARLAQVPGADIDLAAVLAQGIRVNRALADRALIDNGNVVLTSAELVRLFEVVEAPATQVQFTYVLSDEGSGRAFQSGPILNIAGLGIADGDRPFRAFRPPITFAPRTTIRMDVTELSSFPGDLHVSLHGYKVLR